MSVCAQLLINGKFEDAAGGKTFETMDPRSGEPLMTVAEAQAEDVDRAVKAARQVTHLLHNPPDSNLKVNLSPVCGIFDLCMCMCLCLILIPMLG